MKKLPKVIKDKRGRCLRVWRAERNLTSVEAALRFGVVPSFWSLLENGERNAGPQLAARLAKATQQPIELFLGIAVTR